MIVRPKIGKVRFLVHGLLIVLGWGGYFILVYCAFLQPLTEVVVVILSALLVSFFLIVFSFLWSRNQRITRQKEEKNMKPHQEKLNYEKDWLGYSIYRDENSVKTAQYISIKIHQDAIGESHEPYDLRKIYTAEVLP